MDVRLNGGACVELAPQIGGGLGEGWQEWIAGSLANSSLQPWGLLRWQQEPALDGYYERKN